MSTHPLFPNKEANTRGNLSTADVTKVQSILRDIQEEKKEQLIPGDPSFSKILDQIVAIDEAIIRLACHK